MNKFLKRAKELEDEIIKNRRFIHKNAELGYDLPITTGFVKEKLIEMGYEPQEICKSGIVATVSGKKEGKTILLRADMDALAMKEETDLEFKSVTSYAHTCGHDMHTAMLLGAAKILKEHQHELEGTVKFMFQPAEEGLHGADAMIESGVLNNPDVDVAMAMHVDALSPLGLLKYGKGDTFASCDNFEITIIGKGGHGARPNETVDPINVAVHIHLALQSLISREVMPSETCVLTVCSLNTGNSFNIIPNTAAMKGTIRTYSLKERNLLVNRLKEVCETTAKSFRAEVVVNITGSLPAMYCDEKLSDVMVGYAKEIFDENEIDSIPVKKIGSEDFALISEKVPSMYLFLGAGINDKEGYTYGQHTSKVVFNEDILYLGSALYAYCAKRWLEDN